MVALVQAGRAEDVVIVSRPDSPAQSRRTGTILDFTGETLTLQLSGGREEQIASSRVLRYETQQVADQTRGDQLFAEGRYADAVVSYLRAVEVEQRTWMRREILARLVWCYKNMGQPVRAGDMFLLIVRSDPTTQLLDALPLAWSTVQPATDLRERAVRWMDDAGIPASRLLGASWLMSSPDHHRRAVEVLQNLAATSDQQIALLAETQLWRERLVTASLEDVQRWEAQLSRLDARFRAGPYFLLGQAFARHSQHEAAALALLRLPILYPREGDLAAEALLLSGEQLDKMGDHAGARVVYGELVRAHPRHRLAPLAEQRLDRSQSE